MSNEKHHAHDEPAGNRKDRPGNEERLNRGLPGPGENPDFYPLTDPTSRDNDPEDPKPT